MIERGPGRPKKYVLASTWEQVPGVTTICGRFKESGGLLQWAFQKGRSGADKLYDQAAEDVMDIGTLVHSLVEADIHGAPHPQIPPAFEARVVSAYSAWRDWQASSRFEIVATEVPLLSEKYRFGGTPDIVARFPTTGLCLLDVKSSNAIYVDYLLQLAAYGLLWEENREPINGYHIVRFSKEHGDFEHRYFPNLDDAKEEFVLLRAAYDLDKKLQGRVK